MAADEEKTDIPYKPIFGRVPEVMAGRSELLDRHVLALRSGPGDPLFTRVFVGERGVGKTAYLAVLERAMREQHGWIVLHHQAREDESAIPDLLTRLPDATTAAWGGRGRGQRELQRELTVEVNAAIVKVSGRVSDPTPSAPDSALRGFERALRKLGPRATERDSGILIAIDEAQVLNTNHLGELGAIAQVLAHEEDHPIALALAGTRELTELLLASGTFLERQRPTELQMLTRDEASLALIEPAAARGVRWEPDALKQVVDAARGYPYFIQLGGYHAWEHAAGATTITRADADHASDQVIEEADRIFIQRWRRLGPAQKQYLAAAAIAAAQAGGGIVRTGALNATLGKTHAELTRVRSALINDHRLLRASSQGEIQFTIPRFADWLHAKLLADTDGSEFSSYLTTPRPPQTLGPGDADRIRPRQTHHPDANNPEPQR